MGWGGFRGTAVTGAPLTERHLEPKERPQENEKQQQETKTKRTKRENPLTFLTLLTSRSAVYRAPLTKASPDT